MDEKVVEGMGRDDGRPDARVRLEKSKEDNARSDVGESRKVPCNTEGRGDIGQELAG